MFILTAARIVKKSIEEIYARYGAMMKNLAYSIIRDYQYAEDSVQESLLAISKNLDKLDDVDSAKSKNYIYTELLLNWTYLVFFVTVIALVVLGLWQFASVLKTNPKSALMSFVVAALFILMLVITYSMGDGTPLTTLNADSQTYNTSFWLKCTDMWIMSSIVLFVLIIVAIAAGAVKKMMSK